MLPQEKLSISVVSHGQAGLVADLLDDLRRHCKTPIEIVLTLNLKETLPFAAEDFAFPVRIIENDVPKGFGANHNAAFERVDSQFFCVLNPDVRLQSDIFPALMEQLRAPRVAAVAPAIVGPGGEPEDSARRFPTFLSILAKALTGSRGNADYADRAVPFSPDWIAGMFMLFRAEVFHELGGFDERYYLYYEDVDLCARLRHRDYQVCVVPEVCAVHYARRESHRNIRYLLWHVKSLVRFLVTTARRRAGGAARNPRTTESIR